MGNLPTRSQNGRLSTLVQRTCDPHPELTTLRTGHIPESVLLSALVTAVITNNVEVLKILLKKINTVNVRHKDGTSLLQLAIINDSKEIFKYLINHPDINIDILDNNAATPLFHAVSSSSSGIYYVRKLIKKNANINKTDQSGSTPLHHAINLRSAELCHILISAGSDVNAQTVQGITPIHLACKCKNAEIINMLLYFRADVHIPDSEGFLPLMLKGTNSLNLELRLILYCYTFDERKSPIELRILIRAMIMKWPLFPEVFKNVSHIIYNDDDLHDFSDSLIDMKCTHLGLFLEKFPEIFEEMLSKCCTLSNLLVALENSKNKDCIEILQILLENSLIFEIIQSCCSSVSPVSSLIKIFHKNNLPLTLLTETVCCFLSYGARLTCTDLSALYQFYDRCELFEILLHMDVKKPKVSNCCGFYDHEVLRQSIMPYFIYDVNLDIDRFLENPRPYLLMDLNVLLDYFAVPKLKEFFEGEESQKIQRLPSVPSLVELARNATRSYIIRRFEVQNCRQFYTILGRLPVGKIYKEIISFQRRLYNY